MGGNSLLRSFPPAVHSPCSGLLRPSRHGGRSAGHPVRCVRVWPQQRFFTSYSKRNHWCGPSGCCCSVDTRGHRRSCVSSTRARALSTVGAEAGPCATATPFATTQHGRECAARSGSAGDSVGPRSTTGPALQRRRSRAQLFPAALLFSAGPAEGLHSQVSAPFAGGGPECRVREPREAVAAGGRGRARSRARVRQPLPGRTLVRLEWCTVRYTRTAPVCITRSWSCHWPWACAGRP
jgi:hypothetical protein